MKFGMNIGAGPVHLDSDGTIQWENSDFAQTDSSKSWKLEKFRDFTKPMEDISNGSVDIIVAWHILEHMGFPTERNAIIQEWKRVLSLGGHILLACPDVSKIAKHIVDRDGPWQDWFICMVNTYGPYNGFIGDVHRWGYNDEEVKKLFVSEHGFREAHTIIPNDIYQLIGLPNGHKLGCADYNVQVDITK